MTLQSLKILFRKQPVFAAINFGGLVVGMTAALLLFKFVRYEQTYDRQSPHAGQIWRVFNQTLSGQTVTMQDANTHSAVGPTLKKDVAGVVDFARLYCGNTPEVVVVANNQPFDVKRYYATDPGFMRMFPQTLLEGNAQTCLNAPHTAVLTSSTAQRVFGNGSALNRSFRIKNGMMAGTYQVTAVVADPPQNTHLKFDMLLSYSTRYATGHQDNFESYWDYNYFQLAPNANPAAVRQRLAQINEQFLKREGIRLEIQPFADIHLHSNLSYELEPNGSYQTVQFLGIIALLIVVIAFINYVNLTTALANERAKEVGVRKALGAGRSALVRQFLMEGFVLSFLAFGTAILFLHLGIESFGAFIGRPLNDPSLGFDGLFWGVSVGTVAVISLLTGLYPALQLAGTQSVSVLKGTLSVGSAGLFRKGLVVTQFACSVALLIGVFVVTQQLQFLKNHDLGINLRQIVTLKANPAPTDSTARQRLGAFKTACAQLSGVEDLTFSNVVPGLGINTISGSNRPLHWVRKPDYVRGASYFVETDADFFRLFGVKVLAGKHQFFEDRAARFRTVSINEKMRKSLGFPSAQAAVGEQIAYENSENGATMTIGAVVEDFHIESLKTTPQPTLYYCFAPENLNYISLKIKASQMTAALETVQIAWEKIYPDQPFNYWFLDENFAAQYRAETQFNRVFGLFAALAILISCLGLFGLVAYSVQRRTKEIGIRKVLGASVGSLVAMLGKDFLMLIGVAIVIACPVGYYLMAQWLQDFAYRVSISGWVFVAAISLTVGLALLTIGYHALKAALMNPVKSLKVE
ncbi:MAG: ABC transporter permease [Spirosomaceae bacterium]|nr:ABC transporter permease [Spirosomataceae bacterium]